MEPTKIIEGPVKRVKAETGREANYYLCDDGIWYTHEDFAELWELETDVRAYERIKNHGLDHPRLFTKGPMSGKRKEDDKVEEILAKLSLAPFDHLIPDKPAAKGSRKKKVHRFEPEVNEKASSLKCKEILKAFNKKMEKKGFVRNLPDSFFAKEAGLSQGYFG